MAKGKYQLQVPHYFPGDLYLETGTIVGDGTDYPIQGPPSLNMTPLDGMAQDEIKRYNTDRQRPDIPVPPINPTGANLAAGPGQVITTSLSSGPPRNEGASRVPGPPGYNEGAPAIRGTPMSSQRLTPTEQKIADERAEMEAEDRRLAEEGARNAGLERARAAARAGTMVSSEELARQAEADNKAEADAEADRKAAEAAKQPAKPSPTVAQAKPSVPSGGAGAAKPATTGQPGFKPTLENSLPKPG